MIAMVSRDMQLGVSIVPKVCVHPNCGEQEHLAFCHLCLNWVCPKHRAQVGNSSVDSDGRRQGGINACCMNTIVCDTNQQENIAILGKGSGVRGKGQGSSRKRRCW